MSTTYEITGTVHIINEEQSFPSGFVKREFVINVTDGKYPQLIKIEAVKEKCNHLNSYSVGDPITVSYNLEGREYNGKYWNTIKAWKFDRAAVDRPAEGARSPEFGQRSASQNGVAPPARDNGGRDYPDGGDDIPFNQLDWRGYP